MTIDDQRENVDANSYTQKIEASVRHNDEFAQQCFWIFVVHLIFREAAEIRCVDKITELDHENEPQRVPISSFGFHCRCIDFHSIVLAFVKLFHFSSIYCLFALTPAC